MLGWELSNSLEVSFCLRCLRQAKERAGAVAEIIKSDQGCQFTGREWIESVQGLGMRLSHDGKGRALDNVRIERLWRSVKVEEVYLHDYADAREARHGLEHYLDFYNHRRPHQALAWLLGGDVFLRGKPVQLEICAGCFGAPAIDLDRTSRPRRSAASPVATSRREAGSRTCRIPARTGDGKHCTLARECRIALQRASITERTPARSDSVRTRCKEGALESAPRRFQTAAPCS